MVSLRSSTMLGAALSLLACFSSLATAGPVIRSSDLAVKDYHPAPRAWSNLGPAPRDHLIHLTIGLSQSRFHELERHLNEGTGHSQIQMLNESQSFFEQSPTPLTLVTDSISPLRKCTNSSSPPMTPLLQSTTG